MFQYYVQVPFGYGRRRSKSIFQQPASAGGVVKHETLSGKRGMGNPLDLRRWLSDIERLGELREVRGVDWNLELGAISELNVKKAKPDRKSVV